MTTYTHILEITREAEPPANGILSRTVFEDDRLGRPTRHADAVDDPAVALGLDHGAEVGQLPADDLLQQQL